jgi:hypothetical protein
MILPPVSRKIRRALARLLPHDNVRCVAPPGKICPAEGKLILLPSMMRSGTHILIDVLLNNFPAYRRRPLYVDLFHYLARGGKAEELKRGGCYVIKTHYPNTYYSADALAALKELAADAYIIQPVRRAEDVRLSQAACGLSTPEEFPRMVEAFDSFWRDYPKLSVQFTDLTDPTRCPAAIEDIGRFINQKPVESKILPPAKDATRRVLMIKAMTRLLGRNAPVINTTIGFALTERKSVSR